MHEASCRENSFGIASEPVKLARNNNLEQEN